MSTSSAPRRELPGGKTIAQGLLTLSLMPSLAAQTLKIRKRSRSINYGSNQIRFPAPVNAVCGFACIAASKDLSRSRAVHV
jgi:hypothetical protein